MQDDIEQAEPGSRTKRRHRMPSGYPVLAEIEVEAIDWFRFQRLVGDTPVTRIIDHEGPKDGSVTVFVACADDDVQKRLEQGWA
jgi:hypothetical protein